MNELKISHALSDLLQYCETECQSSCCGIQAFDLSEARVSRWLELNRPGLAERLAQSLEEAQSSLDRCSGMQRVPAIGLEVDADLLRTTLSDIKRLVDAEERRR